MKKLLSVFTIVMLLCTMLAVSAHAAGSGSLTMTSANGSRGETVSLSVKLNSNPGLVTMSIRVSYDTSVLQLTGVSNSGLLVGAQLNSSYGSPYSITWVDGTTTSNNTATGTIATFTFKIKDDAPMGDSTVTLQFLDSFDVDYGANSFSASSGRVTVACKSHSYGNWAKIDDAQHGKTCSICQGVQKEAHTWDKGDTIKEANCTEGGQVKYTCTTCSATKTQDVEKTNDHKFGAWTKVSDTQHKSTCSVCQKEDTVDHTWDKGTTIKQASCKEGGQVKYTCTGCKDTKTVDVEKTDTHKFNAWAKISDTEHKRTCSVCEKEEAGNHSYKTSWSKNKSEHWHECSVCKDKKDAAKHTPGAAATETRAQTCTTCGYVIKAALGHKHKYATEWTTDETGHWYTCSGCEEKGEFAEHDFENACDPDCSVCGYTRETAHTYEEVWTTDEQNHWHVCSGCGLKDGEAAHEPGAEATATTAQTCTICGYEIAPALGGAEDGQPDANAPAQQDENGGFPWWIIVVAVVVVGGAAAVIFIKKKK